MKRRRLSSRQNRRRGTKRLKMFALAAILALFGAAVYFVGASFRVREVSFCGNKYLSGSRLLSLAGRLEGENLFLLSPGDVAGRLLSSPWIRSVSVRKEFPDGLGVMVSEAAPEALLQRKGRLFLIDGMGNILENINGDETPFMPVILSDRAGPEALREAVFLAKALKKMGLSTEKNRVEISGLEAGRENLQVSIDGLVIKVGQDQYEEKLSRLFELRDEITKRGIAVDYVDLRFVSRVIVKPVAEVPR